MTMIMTMKRKINKSVITLYVLLCTADVLVNIRCTKVNSPSLTYSQAVAAPKGRADWSPHFTFGLSF